jgi:hypothetical protein
MAGGAVFPPIEIMEVDKRLLLTGGAHRTAAVELNGGTDILAHVRAGTWQDAVLAAARADAHSGLKRNNKDKRKAAEALLATEWGRGNSDQMVADAAGVHQTFVSKLRRCRATQDGIELPAKRTGKDGKTRSAKSKSKAREPAASEPEVTDEPDKAEPDNSGQTVISAEAHKAQYAAEEQQLANADLSLPDANASDLSTQGDQVHHQVQEMDEASTDDAPPAAVTTMAAAPKLAPARRLDPADFLNASPEERTAFVELIGLGAMIDALPEIKLDAAKPLNDEHFRRMCRLVVGALRYVQANDASNAVDALHGVLRVLGSQGCAVDDLAVALGAILKTKKPPRSVSSTFKNAGRTKAKAA